MQNLTFSCFRCVRGALLVAVSLTFMANPAASQDSGTPDALTFEVEFDWTATDVLSQGATGTCWSYSTTSFLESEVFRLTGELVDLSEMAAVRYNYPRKADMYVRYQGQHQFGPGSLSHDVIDAMSGYGVVPLSAYDGAPGEDRHDHGEMDAILRSMVEQVVKRSGRIQPQWRVAFDGVLDSYLGGPLPESFDYKEETYTPASFRDALELNAASYVNLTSFSHHPFGEEFILEIPDNYSHGSFWNMELDQFIQVIDRALEKGFTIAWDADVSGEGFRFGDGLAVAPEGSESVTQATRQAAFDSQVTTDDHLMHMVGRAKGSDGQTYYIIKNSWGTDNPYGGRQYVSVDYVRMNTISVLLHEDALGRQRR
jgi:bleomycin hydrolase